MYVYLYNFGAHVYLMYFLMDILMYICLCGRYFLNPFNGCSFYDLRFVWKLGCTSVLSNIALLLDPRKRIKGMLNTCIVHCSRRNEKFQAEGSLLTFTSMKSCVTGSSTQTMRVHSRKWFLIERSLLILQEEVVQQLLGKWMIDSIILVVVFCWSIYYELIY